MQPPVDKLTGRLAFLQQQNPLYWQQTGRVPDSCTEKLYVFLAWPLPGKNWRISWIVWPVAGVLFAAVREVVLLVQKRRKSES